MPRYLPETREVSVKADRATCKRKLVVQVRNKVPESPEDFILSFVGGNKDRATEWLVSHVISDENVDVRTAIEGLEPTPEELAEWDASGKCPASFQKRIDEAAEAEIREWNAEKSRKVGKGTTAKAKFTDEITGMLAAGKSADEIQKRIAEFAARMGIAQAAEPTAVAQEMAGGPTVAPSTEQTSTVTDAPQQPQA